MQASRHCSGWAGVQGSPLHPDVYTHTQRVPAVDAGWERECDTPVQQPLLSTYACGAGSSTVCWRRCQAACYLPGNLQVDRGVCRGS